MTKVEVLELLRALVPHLRLLVVVLLLAAGIGLFNDEIIDDSPL